MSTNEFKFLSNTMEDVSIKYGILLILWGVVISYFSNTESLTSWIPAFLGFPIFLFGWLARLKPNKKKLFMHFVVLFGLVAFLGGLDFLRGLGSELGPFANVYAGSSKLMLLLSGGLFCYLCIKSFSFARKSKGESEPN
jgi:phosphoglycerol transferase MdoB-like AlkP superfamily enzyme